MSIHSKHNTN